MSELLRTSCLTLRRHDRFLIAELLRPHRVLASTQPGGGLREDLRHIANVQVCEGRGHHEACEALRRDGPAAFHAETCAAAGLDPATTVCAQTAANMACAALETMAHAELSVSAVVTAGVASNATRAGDPSRWHEAETGGGAMAAGTIVTLLFVDVPLSAGALATAAMLAAEAKSAVLGDWRIASRQSGALATGTGTDQFAIAAPLPRADEWERRQAGTHHKLGECLGQAVDRALRRALRQQNGLDETGRRNVLVALQRHGLDEELLRRTARRLLPAAGAELLEQNLLALVHDPRAAAAAHALAGTLDLAAVGILPDECAAETALDQAALLATAIAWQPERFAELRVALAAESDPASRAAAACARGFALRWG